MTRAAKCVTCELAKLPTLASKDERPGLCEVHRFANNIGLAELDADGVRERAIPLMISRLNSRASQNDGSLARHALALSADVAPALLVADLGLALMETEVVSEKPNVSAILDARQHVMEATRRYGREFPDDRLTRIVLDLRVAGLEARAAHRREDYEFAIASYERARALIPPELAEIDVVIEEVRLQRSLLSASTYLAGRQRDSRTAALSLLQELPANEDSHSSSRMVLAKAIEHELALNRIDDAVEVASRALLVNPLVAISPGDAINHVISLRDAALALGAYGEHSEALTTLDRARSIALDLGLADQVIKIGAMAESLERDEGRRVPRARRDGNLRPVVVFVHGFNSDGHVWGVLRGLMGQDPLLHDFESEVFEYATGLFEFNPLRRLPDFDTVAAQLSTFLKDKVEPNAPFVLVGHSQGGLVIQHYLCDLYNRDREQLGRIRTVMLFACPNLGSAKLLGARQVLSRRNRQEKQLRPLDEVVAGISRTIVLHIAQSVGTRYDPFRVPFVAFVGAEDDVVSPASAKGNFEVTVTVPGDHGSIVRPDSRDGVTYSTFRKHVLGPSDVSP